MKSLTTILAGLILACLALPTLAQEKPSLLYGKVISVDTNASKVVIAPKEGPQVTVASDANTTVQVAGKAATLGDVKAGMTLRVSPATGTATDLRAFPAQANTAQPAKPSLLYGQVISVDTATGKVVIAPKEGPQVTVTTDKNTKVYLGSQDATLADVKSGMILRVNPATGVPADIRAFPQQPSK